MTPAFWCTIPMAPMPWKRTKGSGRRRYKDPRYAEYQVALRWHLTLALRQRHPRSRGAPLYDPGTAVAIELDAFWPCKGRPRARDPWPRRWKPTRPDGDNVLKGVTDASEGLLVADDGQYALATVRTFYASQEGPGARLEVRVWALEDVSAVGTFGECETP